MSFPTKPLLSLDKNLDWKQLPLDFGFPSANRVASLLALTDTEATRIQKLLLRWSSKYGSVNIRVNNDVIIIGERILDLSDITRDDKIHTPTSGKLLFNSPDEDLVETKDWMNLYNQIPWTGLEKAQNFLTLLGHEHGPSNCLYWTNETMENEVYGYHHWMLHIHVTPERYRRVPRTINSETDLDIHDFGDDFVFFTYAPIGTLAYNRKKWEII